MFGPGEKKRIRAVPTAFRAVILTCKNLGTAFSLSWPWLALLMTVAIPVNLLFAGWWEPPGGGYLADESSFRNVALIYMLCVALISLTFASIAVNWHRYLLRGECASGWSRLRLDAPVWVYFASLSVIQVLTHMAIGMLWFLHLFVGFAVGVGEDLADTRHFAIRAAMVLLLIFVLLGSLLLRACIALPGLGEPAHRYRWSDSRGHTFQLLVLTVLLGIVFVFCGAATLFAMTALSAFDPYLGPPGMSLGRSVFSLGGAWFIVLTCATCVTILYAAFAEGREV
jgi:hypothetical protein